MAAPATPQHRRLRRTHDRTRPRDARRVIAAAWPCGYCRVESTASLGDTCPHCERPKAMPWWRADVSQ